MDSVRRTSIFDAVSAPRSAFREPRSSGLANQAHATRAPESRSQPVRASGTHAAASKKSPIFSPPPRQIKWDMCTLDFHPNSLKTNESVYQQVGHFFGRALAESTLDPASEKPKKCAHFRSRPARAAIAPALRSLLSSGDAPKINRLMKSVRNQGNFLEPSAPRWAFVFIQGAHSGGESTPGNKWRRNDG
jgi:hypothetical protein